MKLFNIKTKILKLLAAFLGFGLIIFGFIHRKKKKAFSGQYITGIFFHNPSKALFEKCVLWLKKNGYVFISTEQLVNIIGGELTPKKGAVWITFDDGWKENVTNVIPIVIKYKMPVTFFISTYPVENNGVFWFSLARKYQKYLPGLYQNKVKKLWSTKESKRKELMKPLEKRFSKYMDREAMTTEDIKNISKIPFVTIGSHTVNHVITPNCSDSELEYEINHSRFKLNKWTGKKIKFFSYPNGDFDRREQAILKKEGFILAATIEKRFISPKDNPYFIPRFYVDDNASFPEAIYQMVGISPILWIKTLLAKKNDCEIFHKSQRVSKKCYQKNN